MKFVLGLFIFLTSVCSQTVAQQSACVTIQKTDALFHKKHIAPLNYTTAVYHEIFNLYLESIDAEQMLFSVADSMALHAKVEKAVSLCEVYTATRTTILKRIKSHDSLLKTITLAYLSDDQLKETFVLPCSDEIVRQPNDKALMMYDKKFYKYFFIEKKYVLKEAGVTLEPQKVWNSIVQKRSDYLAGLINKENELLNLFLKALTLRHDPHSAFFDANEKQEWLTHLSKEEYSFGFEMVETDNDLYKISEMIPGGAAWNSRQMEVGDIIDRIELESGKKYVVGIDSDEELYSAFQGMTNKTLTFYLTTTDGTKKKVRLTKAKTEVFDNVINGYVFRKDNQRLGYIELPSFYSAEPGYTGNGSASDLAREISQLKKDSIDGLIIDLRGNGGGYMHEALGIAGLFIDEGILALKQEKGDKPRYLKDPNRGTLYDGKLIILVNNYSASASELLAGTLQQYHRAIIVGNTTFGKATMQGMYPVDSIAETKNTNTYYANVTVGKFYMINKKTHQAIGIIPDIHLPSFYDFMDIEHESEMLYYLTPDSVSKALELPMNPAIELKQLKINSEKRIQAGQWEFKFKTMADSISFYICHVHAMELNTKSLFAWEDAKFKFFKNQEQANPVAFTPYPISNTSVYNKLLKDHELYTKSNAFKIADLKRDVRLFETLNILSDYISQP
ncbi:MAG: hypothetical protein JWO58_1304 [Chitinophagaceae bacterium]|nr:hypothetical protein [Chitinophagaceae bacterium]